MSDPLGLTGNVDALVCDLTSGMCGTGEASAQRVTVTCVTDPICSACWAMEPAWRAVQYRFGDLLDVRHVYGGLLPSWDGFADPANGIRGFGDVGHHWRQIAEQTGQALNASVWDVDPIESSFPPSMVLAAARDTAPELDGLLLRRLREDLFVHGRNIARPQVWGPVLSRAGIDPAQVEQLLRDGRARDLFAADLRLARSVRVSAFPTLILEAGDDRVTLRGVQPLARLEQAISTALGVHRPTASATIEEAVAFLGVGTTAEYAALLDVSQRQAEHVLSSAGVTGLALSGGSVWTP